MTHSGKHTFLGGTSLLKDIVVWLQKVGIHCHVSHGIQRRQHRVMLILCNVQCPLQSTKKSRTISPVLQQKRFFPNATHCCCPLPYDRLFATFLVTIVLQ